jgi:FAD-dependent oxidoreductase domain-containing protein 1
MVGGSLSERGKHYDVLVIGAGIIGLSTAYHIKENHPDLSVLVIDRGAAPAQGDTAKSMAGVRDTFTSDVNRLLTGSSIAFYKHVQSQLGFNLNLELIGYLWLLTAEEFKAFEAIEEGMRKHGIRLRIFDREDLATMIPDLMLDPSGEQSKLVGLGSVEKGVQGLDCGVVAPELIAKFYENEFNTLGGEFQFKTEAKALQLDAKRKLGLPGEPYQWQDKTFRGVDTNHGEISADTLVVAAGSRTPFLLDPVGIDCHVKSKKHQIFQFRGGQLDRLLNTNAFNEQTTIPFTILPNGAHFRPARSEKTLWVSTAEGIGTPFSFEEEPVADESFYTYNIYPILSEYFPCFTGLRPINSWAGLYDINSIDSTPIIERISNCIVAAGLSGSGIMKADAVGRMVAAVYDGREEATLFGDKRISTRRLGLTNRSVEKEKFVI